MAGFACFIDQIANFLNHANNYNTTIEFENRGLTHPVAASTRLYSHSPDLSLTELAEVINIAPYFASLFKQAMAVSPHQYVIQQRVEQAKLMLSKTDLIANIALEVGFSSQNHLNQQFKRFTGMTPKQVRPSP